MRAAFGHCVGAVPRITQQIMSASTPLLPSVAKELPDTARDAYAAATEDVQTRLTRRLPPLVLTLCIEMGNAAIIMSYSGELLRYPLLVGFIPVISALGGNIGLQSSSITTSALSHGLASADEATATIRHEMSAVVFLSAALSAMLFAIAATWRSIQDGAGAPDLVGTGFRVWLRGGAVTIRVGHHGRVLGGPDAALLPVSGHGPRVECRAAGHGRPGRARQLAFPRDRGVAP